VSPNIGRAAGTHHEAATCRDVEAGMGVADANIAPELATDTRISIRNTTL